MEKALEQFIAHWKDQPNVRGIMLTGSYAVGIPKEDSDVDIRLILDDTVTTSFKGLQTIDGYCFSYIGRSKAVTLQKFNRQFFSHVKMEARIYNVGKILLDPFGDIAEIIAVAKTYAATPLIKKEISQHDLQLHMYSIYKKYQYLLGATPEDPFYDYNYILYLKNVLTFYAEKLNAEMVYGNDSKLVRFLTDEIYIKTYDFPHFPDKTFKKLWLSALSKKDKQNLQQLHDYLRIHLYNFNESTTHIEWEK